MAAMNWTTEKPVRPGWYWHRLSYEDYKPEMVKVQEIGYKMHAVCPMSGKSEGLEGMLREWAGPLEPPA